MKKKAALVGLSLMLICLCNKTFAQYYFFNDDYYDSKFVYEIGGSTGLMNCLTDLGGKKGPGKPMIKDLNPGVFQLAGSVYAAATYKNAVALRLEYTFGMVKAYDSILKPIAATTGGRYDRNLNFRSKISEISLVAELHPLFIFFDWEARDQNPPRISPYLLLGIGYFSFNPQASLNGQWIDLHPLHTEGEGFAEYPDRKEYSLQQINFPIGFGLRYELSPLFNIRAELEPRVLQTDYLDDVSTRYIDPSLFSKYLSGTDLTNALILNDRRRELNPSYPVNPKGGQIRGQKKNDAYFTFMLKFGINFGRERIN